MSSQSWYVGLVAVVVVARGVELAVSERNRRWSLAQGGVESGAGQPCSQVAWRKDGVVGQYVELDLIGAQFGEELVDTRNEVFLVDEHPVHVHQVVPGHEDMIAVLRSGGPFGRPHGLDRPTSGRY